MKRFRHYQADLLLVAGFLLLPLLLYGNVTVGDRTMLPADNLFQWAPWAAAAETYDATVPHNSLITDLIIENYAWKRFILKSWQAGEIPLWNPYLFAGVPFLAAGQHSAYYPFSILFLILPLSKAYGWYTVSQLWLAGVLMYVFGRILQMRRASAALAGLVYQGCGFMLTSAAVFPMVIGAAVWLPLLLGCIEKVMRGWRLGASSLQSPVSSLSNTTVLWALLGAVALGLQILAGHIEITYYTLLVMAVYAAWRLISVTYYRWRITPPNSRFALHTIPLRPILWLVGMVLLGLMLGAIQLIPLYEVGQANFREGSASFAEVQGYAFPKRRLLTLALPNFFGNPTHHSYVDVFDGRIVPFTTNYYGELNPHGPYTSSWGIKNYVEGGIYFGILPLFLTLPGIYAGLRHHGTNPGRQNGRTGQRRSTTLFWVTLSLFSLAFIFGTPLYAILYYGLPFVNQLHTPFRWVFPLSLCMAVLTGFGADYLAATRAGKDTAFMEAGERGRKIPPRSPAILRPFFLNGVPSLITLLAGIAFWGGLSLLVGLFASRLFYSRLEPYVAALLLGLAQAADAFPNNLAFYSYQYRQLFLFGLMLVATGTVLRVSRCPIFVGGGRWLPKRPIWEWMAAVTIVLDLFLANVGFNAAVKPALLEYQPMMVQWLRQQLTAEQPAQWRITSFNPHGDKPFNANSGWLYDIQDVRGYDSIIPRQYTQYMAAIEPQNELPHNRVQPIANWESLNSPLLDVLGVKYVITAETLTLPKLQLAWQGEGLHIYENLAVAPRAYTLPLSSTVVAENALTALQEFDPRNFVVVEAGDWTLENLSASSLHSPVSNPNTPATINSYRHNEVTVTAETAEPAWLILNDSYFPGWKVYVRPAGGVEKDEIEQAIVRVNGNFRGVLLEPGQWTVRFRYSPLSFRLGGLASFMGGVILLFVAGMWGWQRIMRPGAALTTAGSIAKNSVAPMALNLFNKFIDFAFAAFYLRVLGPADAGSFYTAIATAGIFDIVANFGLDILLIRDVSQERQQASRYLLNTTILRFGAALVASLPVFAIIAAAGLGQNPFSGAEIVAIILIMVGMVFSGISKGVTGLFYVYEKAEIPAAMTTATTILKVAFGVAALLLGYGFVGLAAVSILVNILTLAALLTLTWRNFELSGPWQVDWALQRRMIRLGYPLMLIHLLQTIFISVDVVLLRTMLPNGEENVGWYSSAYKWFNALQVVPSFFTLALFPVISREIKQAPAGARHMYRMSLKLMLLLALPVAALTWYLAYPLVGIIGGVEFLPHGAIALQFIIWSIPIGWLNSVTNYVLIALGLERMQPQAFAVAVGFNIVTNWLFIPRFGYVAAAVTTILSEVILLVLFDYYLRQRMAGWNWLEFLWRPLLVTAAMVGVMWVGGQFYPLLGLLLGLLIYPAGLWLLNVFGEAERQIIHSILPARPK